MVGRKPVRVDLRVHRTGAVGPLQAIVCRSRPGRAVPGEEIRARDTLERRSVHKVHLADRRQVKQHALAAIAQVHTKHGMRFGVTRRGQQPHLRLEPLDPVWKGDHGCIASVRRVLADRKGSGEGTILKATPPQENCTWPNHRLASSSGRYVSRLTSGALAVVMAGGRGERLRR